jgi:hypothetical protein
MAADHVDEAALRRLIGRIAAGADCSCGANSPSGGLELFRGKTCVCPEKGSF